MCIIVIMAALPNIIDPLPRHHLLAIPLLHHHLIGDGMDTMVNLTTIHHRLHHHLHTTVDIPEDLKISVDTILLLPHLLSTHMNADHLHHPHATTDHGHTFLTIVDPLDIDLHLMTMVHHHRPRIITVHLITLRHPLMAVDLHITIMDPLRRLLMAVDLHITIMDRLHRLLMDVGPLTKNKDVLPHHTTKDFLIEIMVHLFHHQVTILLGKGLCILHHPHKISDNLKNCQVRMKVRPHTLNLIIINHQILMMKVMNSL